MKFFLTILLLLLHGICNAQNMVVNGDFENYTSCPGLSSTIDSAINWTNPTKSYLAGGFGGTPDYFNKCAIVTTFGVPSNYQVYQEARSGNAYSGISLYGIQNQFREFIEASIGSSDTNNSSLIANQCYHFKMYINLGNSCKWTTHNIGVYFSDTIIQGINNSLPLPFSPQITNAVNNLPDTLNWTLISGNYTASGGEKYLIIGNFDNDSSTDITLVNPNSINSYIYCFIDDVSLTAALPVIDTINISLCVGESYMGYYSTGRYIDTFRTQNCYDSIRILNLSVKRDYCCVPFAPNAFSPNADNLNDDYRISGSFEEYEIIIVNRWGATVFKGTNPEIGWDGKYMSDEAPAGTYFYLLKYRCNGSKTTFIKGDLLLIR